MNTRTATRHDAAALSALAIETYSEAFGHSMQASDLAAHLAQHLAPHHFAHMLEQDTILVAEVEGRLVGYAQFGDATDDLPLASSTDQELRRLYVHASVQRQGIGSNLMMLALAHGRMQRATRIFLDVWEQNQGARRLYERYGFQVIDQRPFVAASGAITGHDLIMVRYATW